MAGYLDESYARALSEFGRPRRLQRCGAWILEREIPGSELKDAMGCYPLFCCEHWPALEEDMRELEADGGLVSVTLVTDPFGDYTESYLRSCFGVVAPFKSHVVVDLASEPALSKHHRYYARRARRAVEVEYCQNPGAQLDQWHALYRRLVHRHRLAGLKAFSRESFARQLSVPGLVMFRALAGQATVGAHLWYVQGDVAYSHLEATDEAGYELMASYALHSYALEWFGGKVRWLDLGGGAGASDEASDPLARFKRGWSPEGRMAYLCGRVLHPAEYERLVTARAPAASDYFPAYRAGELL
jgi:hypothetical protein